MANFEEVATQFVKFYYETFDAKRENLAALYRDNSMLTFESNAVLGSANIVDKLVGLPFSKITHEISTLDAQPSNTDGAVLVLVTGRLLTEGEERPMSFSQTFQLLPDAGSYYVFNDIFKLVFAAA